MDYFNGDFDNINFNTTNFQGAIFIDKNLLAFSLSYGKFLYLENLAAESFLNYDAWQKIFNRI